MLHKTAATGAVIALLFIIFTVFLSGCAKTGGEADEATAVDAPEQVEPSNDSSAEPEATPNCDYPSLPGAVSSAPQFLLTGAPFDVQKFFASPPPDQNAAPLYLDALFEFSLDLENCFPQEEQQKRRPIVQQLQERSLSVQTRRDQDESSVSSEELDAALLDYAVGFEKLDAAQQRSGCLFETGIGISALLPHAQAVREVARWIDIKTQRDVEQGRLDDAQKNIERLLRLSRDLRRRGPIVSQLVSIAMDSVCYEGPVKRLLAAPELTVQQCDSLLAALYLHQRQAVNPMLEGMRSDYVMTRSTIHDLRHRTGDFDPNGFQERWGTDSDSVGALILALGGTGDGSNQHAMKLDSLLAKMTDEDYANEIAKANDIYTSMVDLAGRPYSEQVQRSKAAKSGLQMEQTPLVYLLASGTPGISLVFVRNEAQLRGTQSLVALRRWQLDHQGMDPVDLEAVVTAAGMTEVPGDPYGDGPMRMTRLGGELVIYSIGSDMKDDKAQSDWKFGQQSGDFIFHMARQK